MLTEQRFSRFKWPAIIGLAGYFLYFYAGLLHRILAHYREHQGGDFFHFFAATVAMSRGEDIYRSGTGGYVYPPLLAFLYLPLAHLSARIAAAIVLTFNVPLILVAVVVGSRTVPARLFENTDEQLLPSGLWPLIAILTAALTYGRIKAELAIMQTDVIVLAAYIFGIYWLDRRPALAGAVLGFALNIKYYTLPGLFYFLLRRRWRAAAWFGIAAIFFALLPALRVGLHTDLRYLSIAFGGVLKSVGVETGQSEAAHVHHVYESLSVSITSGISRMVRRSHPGLATSLTALVIILFVLLATWWYRARNLPLYGWPARIAQRAWPFRQLIILEWAGLMIASIAFSPDANLRHMVLVLFPNIIAVTLLLAGGNKSNRIPLLLGLVLQIYALDLFGDLHSENFRDLFFYAGGQGWCLLIFYGVVLWAGLKEISGLQSNRGASTDRVAARANY
jgi:hypothetical protein